MKYASCEFGEARFCFMLPTLPAVFVFNKNEYDFIQFKLSTLFNNLFV